MDTSELYDNAISHLYEWLDSEDSEKVRYVRIIDKILIYKSLVSIKLYMRYPYLEYNDILNLIIKQSSNVLIHSKKQMLSTSRIIISQLKNENTLYNKIETLIKNRDKNIYEKYNLHRYGCPSEEFIEEILTNVYKCIPDCDPHVLPIIPPEESPNYIGSGEPKTKLKRIKGSHISSKTSILDIENNLITKFGGFPSNNMFLTHYWDKNEYEMDFVVLTPSGYFIEVEIKRSWNNFLKDFDKKNFHNSKNVRIAYFCLPKNIVQEAAIEIKKKRHWYGHGDFVL